MLCNTMPLRVLPFDSVLAAESCFLWYLPGFCAAVQSWLPVPLLGRWWQRLWLWGCDGNIVVEMKANVEGNGKSSFGVKCPGKDHSFTACRISSRLISVIFWADFTIYALKRRVCTENYFFKSAYLLQRENRKRTVTWQTNVSLILRVDLTHPSGQAHREHLEKGRHSLVGDWTNLLFITFKRTNHICYCQFNQVATTNCARGDMLQPPG